MFSNLKKHDDCNPDDFKHQFTKKRTWDLSLHSIAHFIHYNCKFQLCVWHDDDGLFTTNEKVCKLVINHVQTFVICSIQSYVTRSGNTSIMLS